MLFIRFALYFALINILEVCWIIILSKTVTFPKFVFPHFSEIMMSVTTFGSGSWIPQWNLYVNMKNYKIGLEKVEKMDFYQKNNKNRLKNTI